MKLKKWLILKAFLAILCLTGIVSCPLDDPANSAPGIEPPEPPEIVPPDPIVGMPAGKFIVTGTGDGFASGDWEDWYEEHDELGRPIDVTVTVEDGFITKVEINGPDETSNIGKYAINTILEKGVIIARNAFDLESKDVDAYTMATATLTGVNEAGNNALSQILFPSMTINKNILVMAQGDTETLDATVSTGGTVIWASNKLSVATVDTNTGAVTAVSEGLAVITATHARDNDDDITAQCLVVVITPD